LGFFRFAGEKNPPNFSEFYRSRGTFGAMKHSDWQKLGQRRLVKIIAMAAASPTLRKSGPRAEWTASLTMVGRSEMIRLNEQYRDKPTPTDILSFPTGSPFWESGLLGDLVICVPTLLSQAKKQGHPPERELDVLLTHGVLHLLGFDHEKSASENKRMARWELKILRRLLPTLSSRSLGLIDRTNSGMESS
jgi:probable rRNA maturation factor